VLVKSSSCFSIKLHICPRAIEAGDKLPTNGGLILKKEETLEYVWSLPVLIFPCLAWMDAELKMQFIMSAKMLNSETI